MNEITYAEKLSDPRWQRFRGKFLESIAKDTDFGWKAECENCGLYDQIGTLHVHHKRYIDGKEPWEYGFEDMCALCRTCHNGIHAVERRFRKFIISLTVSECDHMDILLDELIAAKGQDNLLQATCYAKNEVRSLYYSTKHAREAGIL